MLVPVDLKNQSKIFIDGRRSDFELSDRSVELKNHLLDSRFLKRVAQCQAKQIELRNASNGFCCFVEIFAIVRIRNGFQSLIVDRFVEHRNVHDEPIHPKRDPIRPLKAV